MHKIYTDDKNKVIKNGRLLVMVECLICGHIRWVQKPTLSRKLICPLCSNLGSLFDRINKRYSIDEKSGCHLWTGVTTVDGYAVITYKKKKIRVAKTVLENKLNRPLNIGYETCHTCNIRKCINPKHLYEGTHQQNGADLAKSGKLKGENAFRSKISIEQAKLIKIKIYAGESLVKISRELNVSIGIVDNIKRETSWKWLRVIP